MKLRARSALRSVLCAWAVWAALGGASFAQQTQTQPDLQPAPQVGQADTSGALTPRPPGALTPMSAVQADLAAQEAEAALDYTAWNKMAMRVERAIEDSRASDTALEKLRGQLVEWRGALQGALNANSARITTLREQIAALGPAPTSGGSEPEDLAQRRIALTQQLVRMQAPAIAADEAYRRADGLIGEIDRTVRERQADQLLQIWPAPINPANWVEGLIGLTDTWIRIWDEILVNWADDTRRGVFYTNLPLIALVLALGLGLTITARRWVQDLAVRLREKGSVGAQRIIALGASLGELLFPMIWCGVGCPCADVIENAGRSGY